MANRTTLTTEGNTAGATVTAANLGVTTVTNAAGTLTYAANAPTGYTTAMRVVATGSGANYGATDFTATTTLSQQEYCYLTANPDVTLPIIFAGISTTRSYVVSITTAGKVQVIDSAAATIYTSTASVPLSTWFRVNVAATSGAGTGTIQVAFYTGHSTTATETSALLTGKQLGATGFSYDRFGKASTSATTGTFDFSRMSRSTDQAVLLEPSGVFTTGTLAVNAGLTGSAVASFAVSGTLPVVAGLTGSASTKAITTGSLPITAGFTGTASQVTAVATTGTLPATVGLTGSASTSATTTAPLYTMVGLMGAVSSTVPTSGALSFAFGLVGAGTQPDPSTIHFGTYPIRSIRLGTTLVAVWRDGQPFYRTYGSGLYGSGTYGG